MLQQSNPVQRAKKSNNQTIVVLSGDSVIDEGNVVIEQEVEEETSKHSTPIRGKKQEPNETVSQPISSRPTRAAAAKAAIVEAQDEEDDVEMEEGQGEGQEVVTKARGRPTRASAKVEDAGDEGEDGSSPTRKSTRSRK